MARRGRVPAQTGPAAHAAVRQPALVLSHVSLFFEHDVQALRDVSLSVARGERVCVIGPNGSGKSTLAQVLCGLLAPDEGSVWLLGRQVLDQGSVNLDAYRDARRELGLVFQNPDDQIVTTVVEEDVAFGPENLGCPPHEIDRRVSRELGRVAMQDYAKADPTRLSGGQKQRVAIAGALAMEPRAIVFDEPGALLDVRGRRSILHVMDRLQEAGITQVHITHFMEEAFFAERVIVMSAGHVVLEGTPDEVFSHPAELEGLGLAQPFCARLATRLRALGAGVPWTCDEALLKQEIVNAVWDAGYAKPMPPARGNDKDEKALPDGTPARDAPAIEVLDASFSYAGEEPVSRTGRSHALDQVSFSVAKGTTCSIVGQTGSGKSTLLRLLCALEVPDTGRVLVGGVDTARKRDRKTILGRIGYVMQYPERQLFAETVFQDVSFGPRNLHLSAREVEERTRAALALVGLVGKDDVSPFELSGGQQRLCALAGVLAMRPQTLVLDEPTAGLDPRGREDLHAILSRLHEQGTTIIQVTHSMDDAAHSDQVLVLNQSKILMEGAPREVFTPAHGRLLHDCGLGLPHPLAWAIDLAGRGVPLNLSAAAMPLTTAELASQLAALLPKEPQAADRPGTSAQATMPGKDGAAGKSPADGEA